MCVPDSKKNRGGELAVDDIHCDECLGLRNAFVEAVHDVVALNERHVLAVLDDEANPHRYELLIQAANEKKQYAKYAYMQHRETHGCPCAPNETDRN